MVMKTCSQCKQSLPETEFRFKDKLKKYRTSFCKSCYKIYKNEWNKKHPNYSKEQGQKRYNEYKLKDRYNYYKRNARRKNRVFELSLEDFDYTTAQPCLYCNGFSSGKTFCGIDRLDNTQGYTFFNSVPCCKYCNKMKLDKTHEEFLDHIHKIYKRFKKEDAWTEE